MSLREVTFNSFTGFHEIQIDDVKAEVIDLSIPSPDSTAVRRLEGREIPVFLSIPSPDSTGSPVVQYY